MTLWRHGDLSARPSQRSEGVATAATVNVSRTSLRRLKNTLWEEDTDGNLKKQMNFVCNRASVISRRNLRWKMKQDFTTNIDEVTTGLLTQGNGNVPSI